MVVKLEGTIDGQVILFTRERGDWWKATIPPHLNGIYIVELIATDDAGNQGYACKYILTIDLSRLCVHLRPCPYRARLVPERYYAARVKTECCRR